MVTNNDTIARVYPSLQRPDGSTVVLEPGESFDESAPAPSAAAGPAAVTPAAVPAAAVPPAPAPAAETAPPA